MPAKPVLSALAAEWKNLLVYYNCLVNADMLRRKQSHINHLQCLSHYTNRSYSLFDLKEARFVAHFSSYRQRLSNPMIRLEDPDNWTNLYKQCPKSDMSYYIESVLFYFNTLLALPFDQRSQLVMLTLHWLKNKYNNSDLYLIRVKVIETDDIGQPWLILVEAELLYGFKPKVFSHIRQVFLLNGETNQIEKRFPGSAEDELRESQLKLLRILNEDIAISKAPTALGITDSGFNSRRKRLLLKLNASSIPQVIAMSNLLRLLE